MLKSLSTAAALTCALTTTSFAAVVMNLTDIGSRLLVKFSGSMDLSNLTFDGAGGAAGGILMPNLNISPQSPPGPFDFYNLSSVPTVTTLPVFGTSHTGDVFSTNVSLSGARGAFGVSAGYTGGPLSGAMTVDVDDFSDLGHRGWRHFRLGRLQW